MRLWFAVFLAAFFAFGPAAAVGQAKPEIAGVERKLEHLEGNGSRPQPDSAPTVFTEDEINAYFAAGKVELPTGVRSVHFQAQPGVVTATTQVDFDKLQEGRSSSNPLLSMFTGVHEAVVVAQAHGSGGVGYVQVDSGSLDGVEIPRFVLQLFVEKFLQPKYPGIGLDSKFALPDRIDTAAVGSHTLTIVQK